MGQAGSQAHEVTPEELSRRLAQKFAHKCFNGVELYSFKDNFQSLAEPSDADGEPRYLYWTEDTLIRFLALPASLDVGSIIFASASYVAAFPLTDPSRVPAILDFGNLVKVVAIFTGRYKKVLRHRHDPIKLLFRSLAVYDRGPPQTEPDPAAPEDKDHPPPNPDDPADDDDGDDDDDLSLAALEALDAIEVFRHQERPNILHARIPRATMRKLIALLLVLAPLEENEPIALHVERFTGAALEGLWKSADSILRSFGLDGSKNDGGIPYRAFKTAVQRSMPFLFDGFKPLFTQFLFSKKIDMSRTPGDVAAAAAAGREPLLSHHGRILTLDLLSQIALFVSGERLWRRLRLLYAGSEAGFSNGSLETKVLKWNAPTIVLVSGHRISYIPETSRERAFCDILPPRRYPSGAGAGGDGRVVYGVFLQTPWKTSHKDCFGDANTLLFQLEPVHEVFPASTASRDYASFNRDESIAFGSPVQKLKQHHRPSPYLNLGPVSLTIEPSMEFGVFQHVGSGGSFYGSETRTGDWQDRFEIDEIEVWGCGGESEAEAQRKAWAWEEREALLRRQINLGKDIESDRALLEMAGLIGQNRSGGSMS